jgi:hypothetical protein
MQAVHTVAQNAGIGDELVSILVGNFASFVYHT